MSKELKRHSVRGVRYNGEEICGGFAYYDADEVDAAITEKDEDIIYLKKECAKATQFIDALKDEIESLKASHYAEMVDAGMRERRLRRALYKACANWADRTRLICSVFGSFAPRIRWERMLAKCRAKAEQYK